MLDDQELASEFAEGRTSRRTAQRNRISSRTSWSRPLEDHERPICVHCDRPLITYREMLARVNDDPEDESHAADNAFTCTGWQYRRRGGDSWNQHRQPTDRGYGSLWVDVRGEPYSG